MLCNLRQMQCNLRVILINYRVMMAMEIWDQLRPLEDYP